LKRSLKCAEGHIFESKAKKDGQGKCPQCGKRVRVIPKNIVSQKGTAKQEPSNSPKKKTEGGGSFWDLVKSKREADEDIITTLEKPLTEAVEEEIKKVPTTDEPPITHPQTSQLIGEALAMALKQIAYLMDTENNEPITWKEKTSLLGQAAVLCLNIDIDHSELEPYKISPITLLAVIAILCFLPEIWGLVKNKFFKKKDGEADGTATPTFEEDTPQDE